jgi:hypothetical protein
MYKRIVLLIFVLCALFGLGYYLGHSNAPQPETIEIVHTDTVYVKHVPPVVLKKVTPPKKVRIQKKPDTLRRAQMQKNTLNAGSTINLSDNRIKIDVQTISPVGVVIESEHEYSLPQVKTIAINDSGAVEIVLKSNKELRREKRKRRLHRIANGALVVGAFILGLVVAC